MEKNKERRKEEKKRKKRKGKNKNKNKTPVTGMTEMKFTPISLLWIAIMTGIYYCNFHRGG